MPSGRNEAGGRSPSGRATRPTDQAPAGLGDTASVPNAVWINLAHHQEEALRKNPDAIFVFAGLAIVVIVAVIVAVF